MDKLRISDCELRIYQPRFGRTLRSKGQLVKFEIVRLRASTVSSAEPFDGELTVEPLTTRSLKSANRNFGNQKSQIPNPK